MHLKFQLNPLNGSGVVAIINFKFNQISCLAGDQQKLNKYHKTNNIKVHMYTENFSVILLMVEE